MGPDCRGVETGPPTQTLPVKVLVKASKESQEKLQATTSPLPAVQTNNEPSTDEYSRQRIHPDPRPPEMTWSAVVTMRGSWFPPSNVPQAPNTPPPA